MIKNALILTSAFACGLLTINATWARSPDKCYSRQYTDKFLKKNPEQRLQSVEIAVFSGLGENIHARTVDGLYSHQYQNEQHIRKFPNSPDRYEPTPKHLKDIVAGYQSAFELQKDELTHKVFLLAKLRDAPFDYIFTGDCFNHETVKGGLFCNTESDGILGSMYLKPKSKQKATLEIPRYLVAQLVPYPPEMRLKKHKQKRPPYTDFFAALNVRIDEYETTKDSSLFGLRINDTNEDPEGYRYTVKKSKACLSYSEYQLRNRLSETMPFGEGQ